MTFDEFIAGRTPIADVTKAGRNSDILEPGTTPDPGFEYPSGFYISEVGSHWPAAARAQGAYHLIIGNMESIGNLDALERILYEVFKSEIHAL